MAALAAFVISVCLLVVFQSHTQVTVVLGKGTASAQIIDARVEIPQEALSSTLRLAPTARSPWVEPQSSSQYWQLAVPGLFEPIGKVGEWLQSLRPSGYWEPRVAPASPGDVFTYTYELVGGRTPARIEFAPEGASSPLVVLEVNAEGRNVTWYMEEASGEEQLARAYYRPRGRSSTLGLLDEILPAAAAASLLVLLAWAASLFIPRRRVSGFKGPVLPHMRTSAVPIALFLGGTLLSAAVAVGVLDAIPHVQDEVGYLFQGKIFALGRSYVPTPPGPEFFTNGFIQMFEGKWFAKYPPGFPVLLVPGLWAGLPWLINPLCAGVSLALVYASGVKMFGRQTAAWAGLLGLVSPWVLLMSGSYMSHPSTMMWCALFLYAVVGTHEHQTDTKERRPLLRGYGWALVAGFAIGMAFVTRQWTAAGVGVGVGLWALGDILLSGSSVRLEKLRRYLFVLVGVVPPVLFILYENRQLTGDWLRFTQDLVGSYDRPGFGPDHGDPVGHTPALGVFNALVYVRSLGTVFNGWPVPLALAPLLLGLLAWIRDTRQRLGYDALLWLGTLGLVGAYFVWWSNTTIYGPRYWYEAMPFMLLIAGRGLELLGRLASGTAATRNGGEENLGGALRWAAPGLLFGVMTLYTLTQSIPTSAEQYKDYNGISATALHNAQRAGLKNALVFVALDPAKTNRDYGKVFAANSPLLVGDIVYARDLGAKRNQGLLGLFPGRTAYWLPLDGPPKPGFGP